MSDSCYLIKKEKLIVWGKEHKMKTEQYRLHSKNISAHRNFLQASQTSMLFYLVILYPRSWVYNLLVSMAKLDKEEPFTH